MRGFFITASIFATVVAHAGGFNFTFDSDNQGWTKGDFGNGFANISTGATPATWVSDGSSGHIAGSDHASYAFHFSGDLGGNHGDLFGQTLSLDFQSSGPGGEDPFLILMSSSDFLVAERTILSGPNYTTWQFVLDSSSSFYYNSSEYYNGGGAVIANNAQIQGVLNDLRYIGVSTDITSGGDSTKLDNVQAVPEPATLALLGVAAIAVRRKRK